AHTPTSWPSSARHSPLSLTMRPQASSELRPPAAPLRARGATSPTARLRRPLAAQPRPAATLRCALTERLRATARLRRPLAAQPRPAATLRCTLTERLRATARLRRPLAERLRARAERPSPRSGLPCPVAEQL